MGETAEICNKGRIMQQRGNVRGRGEWRKVEKKKKCKSKKKVGRALRRNRETMKSNGERKNKGNLQYE